MELPLERPQEEACGDTPKPLSLAALPAAEPLARRPPLGGEEAAAEAAEDEDDEAVVVAMLSALSSSGSANSLLMPTVELASDDRGEASWLPLRTPVAFNFA